VIKARSDQMGRSQKDSKKQERLTLFWRSFQAYLVIENANFFQKLPQLHCGQAVRRVGAPSGGHFDGSKIAEIFAYHASPATDLIVIQIGLSLQHDPAVLAGVMPLAAWPQSS
jgi:hypothetical protein